MSDRGPRNPDNGSQLVLFDLDRTSGLAVQGVGVASRARVETAFYRAFTQLLPANATFSMARAATLQAARDLYGSGSDVDRAMEQAWTAVGVS